MATQNNFKSSAIHGTFINSDYPDGSVLANGTFNRDLYVKKCGFEYGKKDGTLAGDKERYGIIAQEVLQILDNLDVNWDGVKGTKESYRVKHDHFFASLVAALQELSQEVDNIEQQILQLEK